MLTAATPGRPPRFAMPYSFRFGLRAPRRLVEPQKHCLFVFGRSQRRTKTERERSISALRIRGLRADRYHGDLELFALSPKHDQEHGSTHRPNSRPKQAQPSPVLRPVSASLRLRLRSAALAVARWDFISILLSQNEQNPSLGGRVTAFSHTVEFFRAPFFVRAPGKSCQNVPAHFDDFPFKATARGRALTRLKLASGRPGPTSRGREMLTHFN